MEALTFREIIIMANKHPMRKGVNQYLVLCVQYAGINCLYKNIEEKHIYKDHFEVIMQITPSEVSRTYRVKIIYRYGFAPRAILLSPKLEKREGAYPHHIFGFDEDGNAKLCVFNQDTDQWNYKTSIAKTFIPWVSTWLNTYEYWLITGAWHYDEVLGHGVIREQDW